MHPDNWSSDTLLAQGYKEGVMPGSYIVAGARTPIGKMSGALADFSAADLHTGESQPKAICPAAE